jgi:drug/metabolite transporter (DMT)-like permease
LPPPSSLEAFLGSSIFVYAMTHTDLSIATPLAALSPLFSVPIGLLLGTETLDVRRLLAIIVTVAGVICLVDGVAGW